MNLRHERLARVVVFSAVCGLSIAACSRYEWKPDYMMPECSGAPHTNRPLRIERELSMLGGGVRGRVVRWDTAAPVMGARVDLMRPPADSAYSDSRGYFHFDTLAAGRYVLRIRAIGYKSWQDTVNVVSDARPEFSIGLFPQVLDGPCSGFSVVRVRKPWWKPW